MLAEIEKFMNDANSSISFRIVNIGGKNLYVEGIKNVVDLSENQVQLQLKKHLLTIQGQGIKVKYLDKSTCVLQGDIFSVVTKWNMNLQAMV